MVARTIPALDRAGRRRALRSSSLAIAAIGATDVALAGGDPFRAGVWGGWIALYLLSSLVIERGPAWVPHLLGLLASSSALLALFVLAAAGDGSRSLYFLLVSMVPVLSVLFSPDDTVDAGLQGVVVLVAGVALQAREGHPPARLVLYGVFVAAVTAAAIHASVGHRRRLERRLEEEARRAQQHAELDQERQRADRWAAIGKLAEGVAHDVNSPLGSLRSNLAFVREELSAGRGLEREVDEAIEDSLQALERIRETVASLRAISVEETPAEAARASVTAAGAGPPAPGRPARAG